MYINLIIVHVKQILKILCMIQRRKMIKQFFNVNRAINGKNNHKSIFMMYVTKNLTFFAKLG